MLIPSAAVWLRSFCHRHRPDQRPLPVGGNWAIGAKGRGDILMRKVQRPSLEPFWGQAVVIGKNSQRVANAVRPEGGQPGGGKGRFHHFSDLARAGVCFAG